MIVLAPVTLAITMKKHVETFPATDPVMDTAYQTLLGQNWIFVIGSLSAYLVSQS